MSRSIQETAERVLAMAERQASHRQDLEVHALIHGTERAKQGLWFGFVLASAGKR